MASTFMFSFPRLARVRKTDEVIIDLQNAIVARARIDAKSDQFDDDFNGASGDCEGLSGERRSDRMAHRGPLSVPCGVRNALKKIPRPARRR